MYSRGWMRSVHDPDVKDEERGSRLRESGGGMKQKRRYLLTHKSRRRGSTNWFEVT